MSRPLPRQALLRRAPTTSSGLTGAGGLGLSLAQVAAAAGVGQAAHSRSLPPPRPRDRPLRWLTPQGSLCCRILCGRRTRSGTCRWCATSRGVAWTCARKQSTSESAWAPGWPGLLWRCWALLLLCYALCGWKTGTLTSPFLRKWLGRLLLGASHLWGFGTIVLLRLRNVCCTSGLVALVSG